ncbi:MAG: M48 family metallopeptidase, partial [Acidobacteriota bacterium]|nr:M48 family metallopeptidase [Acidobacteriota bacterium]
PPSMTPEIEYTARRSGRARRVLVNVAPDGAVEVVLPQTAPQRAATAAIEELGPWIARRLADARATLATLPGRDGHLPYLDTELHLVAEPGRRHAQRSAERLLVPSGNARAAIERFYRRAARREVAARLDRATAIAGRPYTDLTIRAQRTRWASCSASGRMSFNWRLLLAPERVLEYVVWHEVCHLDVPDHSQRFWALVEDRWPSWRRERAWLRKHGPSLMLPPALSAPPPAT